MIAGDFLGRRAGHVRGGNDPEADVIAVRRANQPAGSRLDGWGDQIGLTHFDRPWRRHVIRSHKLAPSLVMCGHVAKYSLEAQESLSTRNLRRQERRPSFPRRR